MGAYSLDLRRRVLASSGAGLETHEVAEKYSVSIAWVNRIKQRYRDTGEVSPKKVGRRQGSKMDDYSDRLGELIEEKPDRTIEELHDVVEARLKWRTNTSSLDSKQLVFLDETGVNTKMARLYARSIGGTRAVDSIPHGHWHTTTFVAGLTYQSLIAPAVLDGPMDGESFLAYTEQILSPALQEGNIVIMDNLACHKVSGVKQAIERADDNY